MRNKQHIVLYLILAGYVCFFAGCSANRQEKAESIKADSVAVGMTENDNLETTFEADTLTTEQLNVFQQRAQQKLQDFINYVEIISNKTYDPEMRNVTMEQIKELFTDSTAVVNIAVTNSSKTPTTLSQFLNNVTQADYDSIKVKTDSVALTQPQRSKEPMNYVGSVSAKVTINGFKNGKVVFNTITNYTAETCISKIEKQFGSESKLVWGVRIGRLK